MKRKIYICTIFIVFLLTLFVFPAAADAPALTASDAMLRAQLRLRDLGYYNGSIDGTDNSDAIAALHACCTENSLPVQAAVPPALFENTIRPISRAQRDTASTAALVPAVTGTPVAWSSVSAQLRMDAIYTVTSCYGAQSFRMRYVGGTGHAHMTPVDDNDAAILLALFNTVLDFGKQPVVITLGGIPIAGSLQAYLHNDDAGDADTVYSLYFSGSHSDIGNLPDVDHDVTIRIAAGTP